LLEELGEFRSEVEQRVGLRGVCPDVTMGEQIEDLVAHQGVQGGELSFEAFEQARSVTPSVDSQAIFGLELAVTFHNGADLQVAEPWAGAASHTG
jgi:hypothetical protein